MTAMMGATPLLTQKGDVYASCSLPRVPGLERRMGARYNQTTIPVRYCRGISKLQYMFLEEIFVIFIFHQKHDFSTEKSLIFQPALILITPFYGPWLYLANSHQRCSLIVHAVGVPMTHFRYYCWYLLKRCPCRISGGVIFVA